MRAILQCEKTQHALKWLALNCSYALHRILGAFPERQKSMTLEACANLWGSYLNGSE